jgi:hypothetical protein
VWTGHDRLVVVAIRPRRGSDHVTVSVQWLPIGHTPPTHLPGPCVEPPERQRELLIISSGVDHGGEFRRVRTRSTLTSHPAIDVDGDARLDVLVPHASGGACPWDVPHDVYVMRGTCGHKIGTIAGPLDAPTHTTTFHSGIREIRTSASWASTGKAEMVPDHHTRARSYRFDGQMLRQIQDDTRSGRCHHCSVSSCSEQ